MQIIASVGKIGPDQLLNILTINKQYFVIVELLFAFRIPCLFVKSVNDSWMLASYP